MNIEPRLVKLEEFATETRERLAKIEARLEQMATRADMHEGFNRIITWIVGVAIVLSTTAVTLMTFVLNNAIPRAAGSQPAPIVITVPQPAPPQTLPDAK